jgi:hypothetical protein
MIWQFRIIIQVFKKPFQSHFSSFFLKFGIMENLVEFYKKIQKLVMFLLLKKHNTKGIFNVHK